MKKFGIILFGLGLLLAQPLSAQNIAPILPDQGTVSYQYKNPGQFQGASWGGIYVGPYEGTLLKIGAEPTNAAMSLYCVDFLHFAIPAQVVTAGVSNLGSGNTSLARAGQLGLESYKKAAFLSSLFQSYTSISQFTGYSRRNAWSGIHGAIWYFMNGTGVYSTGTNPAFGLFRDYANANYSAWDGYSQWSVLTTKAVSGNTLWDSQEFLVRTEALPTLGVLPPTVGELPPTVTPEPQTYILLASGLLMLGFVGRRRFREMGYA